MRFTEDKEISINDLKLSDICYVEYERLDDTIIELARKVDDRTLETLRNNKLIKEYIALYSSEGG